MKNFQKLAIGIDVLPLLNAVLRQPELWGQFETRTYRPESAARPIQDILLRYNDFQMGEDFLEKVCSEIAVVNYPAFDKLPQARGIIFDLMRRVEGERLGRVFIARLDAGKSIPRHSDHIPPAEAKFPDKITPASYYDRYHVVLKSGPGVLFRCGDEQVSMDTGECWWFNNELEHEVINNSADDRVHLIIDIRTYHGADFST